MQPYRRRLAGPLGDLEANGPTYKGEAYVYRECVRLATQLKVVEKGRHRTDVDPRPSTIAYDIHGHRS